MLVLYVVNATIRTMLAARAACPRRNVVLPVALSCQVRVRFRTASDGGGARSDEAGPFLPRPRRTRGSDAASVRRRRRGCHDAARSRQHPQVESKSTPVAAASMDNLISMPYGTVAKKMINFFNRQHDLGFFLDKM